MNAHRKGEHLEPIVDHVPRRDDDAGKIFTAHRLYLQLISKAKINKTLC